MKWALIGCGYVGSRLARRLLHDQHQVLATRRSPQSLAELDDSLASLTDAQSFVRKVYSVGDPLELGGVDVAVMLSPPSSLGPSAEAAFANALPAQAQLIYVSTTGVYAAGKGDEWIEDDHPESPPSGRGAKRLAVEEALRAAHRNTIILRSPAIYGPHRGVHARLLKGDYRLIGDADTYVSRIHADDLASAIVFVSQADVGMPARFVVGDEEPSSSRDHAESIVEAIGCKPPEEVPAADVRPEVRDMLSSNRRIRPAGLRALGWKPDYPTWREGLRQVLEEEGRLGLLNDLRVPSSSRERRREV